MLHSPNVLPNLLSRSAALLGMCAAIGNFAGAADAAYNPSMKKFPKALGVQTLAMVSVDFAGETPLPFGNDIVQQQTFDAPGSVADYYHRASFGQFTIQGNVFGPVTLSPNVIDSNCSDNSLTQVNALAYQAVKQQTGSDISSFTNYGFTLPRTTATAGCDLGGFTHGNGFVDLETRAKFGLTPGKFYEGVVVHEDGHEEGLSHANELSCYGKKNRPVLFSILRFIDGNCREIPYGDPVDPMGEGEVTTGTPPDMSAINKARLGWLKPSNIRTMTHSGVAFIRPLEEPTNGTQLVRVPDGLTVNGEQHYYYLDFRQPVNLDSSIPVTSPLFKGVMIREAGSLDVNDRSLGQPLSDFTEFIDTTPDTPSAVDGALKPGKIFKDSSAGIKFQTLSVSSAGAEIRVSIQRKRKQRRNAVAK